MKKKKYLRIQILSICFVLLMGIMSYGKSEPLDAYAYSGVYDVQDVPYSKEKDIKKVLKKLEDLEEGIYMENNDNIKKEWKRSTENTGILYVGDIKKNRPDGWGIILENHGPSRFHAETKGIEIYEILYMGQFKNGKINGYGCLFEDRCLIYDGQFDNGKHDGKGREYDVNSFLGVKEDHRELLSEKNEERSEIIERKEGGRYFSPEPIVVGRLHYIGDYKSDEYHGKGDRYWGVGLEYSGEWKKGKWDGKGTEYFIFKEELIKKYEGQFKKGQYSGKGVLYYEDGSVNYKGEFRNGEIK